MRAVSIEELHERIEELEARLEESEQLVDAIKSGEVDAFAIDNGGKHEIYTLQSVDYAYRLLVEEFAEGAINVTEDGLIVYSNRYFAQLLQMPFADVVGASIFDFVHEDSMDHFEALFKSALKEKSKGEINLAIGDRVISVYVSLASLRPKLATIGIIITDFTEKKETQKIILEYQKNLEAKNAELVRNNQELASFVYVASHDLQEPLRKIQTFATRLIEKETNLSATGKENFGRMNVAAKRMQTLIEDLLAYSRTNTVERNFENFYINKIIDEVKSDLREEVAEKDAVIDVSGDCEIRAIAFQFKQLMYNLISNALKFSSNERQPVIKIESKHATGKALQVDELLPEQEYCHISIQDNGIGFEQIYSDKIFNVFVRLHGHAEFKGTGVGLAIVKKIIDNHCGIIKAKAEENRGATFDIYVPR